MIDDLFRLTGDALATVTASHQQLQVERDQYRQALERIVAEENCAHWTGKGCAVAMHTIARVALGGQL